MLDQENEPRTRRRFTSSDDTALCTKQTMFDISTEYLAEQVQRKGQPFLIQQPQIIETTRLGQRGVMRYLQTGRPLDKPHQAHFPVHYECGIWMRTRCLSSVSTNEVHYFRWSILMSLLITRFHVYSLLPLDDQSRSELSPHDRLHDGSMRKRKPTCSMAIPRIVLRVTSRSYELASFILLEDGRQV